MREQETARSHIPYGGREPYLGRAADSWRVEDAWLAGEIETRVVGQIDDRILARLQRGQVIDPDFVAVSQRVGYFHVECSRISLFPVLARVRQLDGSIG